MDGSLDLNHSTGFASLPTEVGLAVLQDVPYADRTRFAAASHLAGALVAESLQSAAIQLLLHFHLVYADIRLLLTATGRRSLQGDLDFLVGAGDIPDYQNINGIKQYRTRGFNILLDEYDEPHDCGIDFSCPATLRISDDAGCSFSAFPTWSYSNEAVMPPPTVWSMGGTGCPQGILSRGNVRLWAASYSSTKRWRRHIEECCDDENP
ncbi:hypothetical protein C8F04DRAFT_1198141 [Mycena alexandri]|uniref:Uncharacterized protein n=1 Tax=Mycena alexandri TaxID=1745969 RepID=A0AAD6S1T8_9AGAR|nr:hypothetical protein C8F04DRAFT_1198141 [Mycena alexandri]